MQQIDEFLGYPIPQTIQNAITAVIAVLLGLVLKFILKRLFLLFSKYWLSFIIKSIVRHLSRPIGFFIPLLFLNGALDVMKMDKVWHDQISRLLNISIVITFAVILIQGIKVLEDYFYHKYDLSKEDNLKERKVRTQLQFVKRLIIGTIVFLTTCIVLLSFESMRKIGTGLLTGVGIGGIIIGFAAQKSLGNLLAGFQIAFTQPIRIDDVLVVEGEWGRVEDITLTYVVLNIWDQRRLILPITYFIEKPFQNWTRISSELLGTVFLYLDYNTPIPALRDELTRLLEDNPLWDKRVNKVQVTDNKDNNIEVRFLMSARNSSQTFDLRCYVREGMLAYIREHHPDSLPKTRLEYKGIS
jgi:small-conductance mechanosensitive channel